MAAFRHRFEKRYLLQSVENLICVTIKYKDSYKGS